MKRTTVQSSSIASVGYHGPTNTLEIEFRNGSVYQYYAVPERVFEEFRNATSLGTYFVHSIRNVYPNQRVTEPPDSSDLFWRSKK